MNNNFNTDILQICRTCMKDIADASFFNLDCTPTANTQLTIRQKLYSCIPEIDLSIVSNPVICGKCVDNLLSLYEFKRNCLQSEIQINKYIQQVEHTGDLNLVQIIRFHQPGSTKELDAEVKKEDFDIKVKMKDLDIEVKVEDLEFTNDFKNDNLVSNINALSETSKCTESTEPKYLIKQEMVDTQYALFNTFNDYNIKYNVSAAEENSDTCNSNIARNCLPEVVEHQDNYNKNLNKTNTYQCFRCGYKTESRLKLILHIKFHTRKNLCHREIIFRRFSRYHKNVFYYKCSLCNYLTKYKCLFDFHTRIHLTKKDYKHVFKHTDVHLKVFHTTIKVNKTKIKSDKRNCVKSYKNYNKSSFKNQNKVSKQHSSRHSLKPNTNAHIVQKLFKCSICKYRCSRKSNLKRHVQIHTGKKPFSCSVCDYQCFEKYKLKRHMLIHTEEKPFSCSICEYQCSRKQYLKQHILIHTGEKPFSCSICEYQCNQKERLKQHIQIHTGEKPFSCSVCKYQCSLKRYLHEHMQIHTGEKPFSCSICEYQGSQKRNLKEHMQIHTREKPLSCSICEYRCSKKARLRQHMRVHTGEKPFSCSVCEYHCSQKGRLKEHMRIHTGEKPFSCSVCKYQCSQKSRLKRHMLMHTGEKLFSCSVCEYQCSDKRYLNQHMQIHTDARERFMQPSTSGGPTVLYCICRKADDGETPMLACDSGFCSIEWYHLSCVGLEEVPTIPWLCNSCRSR